MPGHVRAQGLAAAELNAKQAVQSGLAENVSSAQPESENDFMPTFLSPTNSAAQPSDSSSANQSLPDALSFPNNYGYVPLTTNERWRNFWNGTLLSPLSYVGVFGGAFGQQLAGQPKKW